MKIKNIFFCHGGIHGLYMYYGAIKEMKRRQDKFNITRVFGSSSGSIASLVFLLVLHDIVDIDEYIQLSHDYYDTPRKNSFNITPGMMELLDLIKDHCFQDPNRVLEIVNKHLYIGVSQRHQFRFINKFNSINELLHCLVLSCSIALMSSYCSYYNGQLSLDGGYHFRLCDLPTHCWKIYNYGSQFPDTMFHPSYEQRCALIRKGKRFIRQLKHNPYRDERAIWMEHHYSESWLSFSFFLQKLFVQNSKITFL